MPPGIGGLGRTAAGYEVRLRIRTRVARIDVARRKVRAVGTCQVRIGNVSRAQARNEERRLRTLIVGIPARVLDDRVNAQAAVRLVLRRKLRHDGERKPTRYRSPSASDAGAIDGKTSSALASGGTLENSLM